MNQPTAEKPRNRRAINDADKITKPRHVGEVRSQPSRSRKAHSPTLHSLTLSLFKQPSGSLAAEGTYVSEDEILSFAAAFGFSSSSTGAPIPSLDLSCAIALSTSTLLPS